jgi:hypothetical protein
MDVETFKYFKYEIALGSIIPMPPPPIDYYTSKQFSFQQFLHTLCKEHIGALGKKDGSWSFGPDASDRARLGSRSDITELFDFAAEIGIIEEIPPDQEPNERGEGVFVPYQLSKAYWEKFDKFAS